MILPSNSFLCVCVCVCVCVCTIVYSTRQCGYHTFSSLDAELSCEGKERPYIAHVLKTPPLPLTFAAEVLAEGGDAGMVEVVSLSIH